MCIYIYICAHTHKQMTHTHTQASQEYCEVTKDKFREIEESVYNVAQTVLRAATRCNTLQHTDTTYMALCIDDRSHCNTLQHTTEHCNTLQHTTTHCNTLKHTDATYMT